MGRLLYFYCLQLLLQYALIVCFRLFNTKFLSNRYQIFPLGVFNFSLQFGNHILNHYPKLVCLFVIKFLFDTMPEQIWRTPPGHWSARSPHCPLNFDKPFFVHHPYRIAGLRRSAIQLRRHSPSRRYCSFIFVLTM
jgi:hypothetical protein